MIESFDSQTRRYEAADKELFVRFEPVGLLIRLSYPFFPDRPVLPIPFHKHRSLLWRLWKSKESLERLLALSPLFGVDHLFKIAPSLANRLMSYSTLLIMGRCGM